MHKDLFSLLQSSSHLKQFKQIHALIIIESFNLTIPFCKQLLNKCCFGYARQVFDNIRQPDELLFTTFISGYSRSCLHKEAVDTFFLMHRNIYPLVCYTFPSAFRSCAALSATCEGKQIHSLVYRYGFDSNVFIQTALIDFYVKVGELDSAKAAFDEVSLKDPVCYNCLISGYSKSGMVCEARQLFDQMPIRTTVSWNSMITCYLHNGDYLEGLRIFAQMKTAEVPLSESTLVSVLSICAKLGDLKMGLKINDIIERKKFKKNLVLSTAILEMYVKCGAVDIARHEFNKIPHKDVIAWTTMITGYAQNGRASEALELFEQMKEDNVKPNLVTLVSVLSACSQLGSREIGESIGSYIESHGLEENVYVGSALVDMYAKFGNMIKAQHIFNRMPQRDIVSWNSMIVGLALNGFAKDAIDLYMKMQENDIKPNDITFVGLLTACSHVGYVDLGFKFFQSMKSHHNISPKVEHCACVVDLFCRAGRLQEAYEFICNMDVDPNVVIWGTLLSASRTHLNVELAERSIAELLVLEPKNSGNYVLLANVYSSVGRWEDALKVRDLMKQNNIRKVYGYSWIEVENVMHKFLAGDASHPRLDEIYNVVDGLTSLTVEMIYYE